MFPLALFIFAFKLCISYILHRCWVVFPEVLRIVHHLGEFFIEWSIKVLQEFPSFREHFFRMLLLLTILGLIVAYILHGIIGEFI